MNTAELITTRDHSPYAECVPVGNSDLSEMMEVAASPQFSFDARSANLDHSFAVCLPLASRCGTRKSGPPPPGQRLEALCETSAEADAGRPSVVAHPTREFGVTGTRLLPSSNPKPSSPGIAKAFACSGHGKFDAVDRADLPAAARSVI